VLLIVFRHRRFYGQVILTYALLYALARFIIEFWRDDPRGEIFGLSTSQFIAIVLFIGAMIVMVLRLRVADRGMQVEEVVR
jgi:phosphatidylglycerol:prolipoprotein diacylglycerol transferase